MRDLPWWAPPPAEGMHYMSSPPQTIIGEWDDASGSFMSSLKRTVSSPFRAVGTIASTAIQTPFNVATRIATTPFNILNRAANALPDATAPGGGGGGGAPAAAAPDQPMSPGDGEGEAPMDMSGFPHHFPHFPHGGHHGHHGRGHMPHWRAAGWGMPNLSRLNPFSHPAGKLLVSATPGGVAATQAHAIAKKALKSGDLKAEHLKKAGVLTKNARAGHRGSIKKIAKIKKLAGQGNPHAEVALDRLKMADAIQRGGRIHHGGTSSLSHLRNIGIATLNHRRA